MPQVPSGQVAGQKISMGHWGPGALASFCERRAGGVHGFGEGYVGLVVDGEVAPVVPSSMGAGGGAVPAEPAVRPGRREPGVRAGRRGFLLSSAAAVRMPPLGRRVRGRSAARPAAGTGPGHRRGRRRRGRRPGRWRQRRSRSSRIAATASWSGTDPPDRPPRGRGPPPESARLRLGSAGRAGIPGETGERRPRAGGGSRASARARP